MFMAMCPRRGELSFGKRMLLKLLKRAMRASDEEIASPIVSGSNCAVRGQRSGGAADVTVRIGDEVHRMPKKTRRQRTLSGGGADSR